MDDTGGRSDSIETSTSWIVAGVALAVLTISYGAPLITVVALKPIGAEFGTPRSGPALAVSLTYIGSGVGGIPMGWLAGRIGLRRVAMSCGTMIAAGLVLASFGPVSALRQQPAAHRSSGCIRHVLADDGLCDAGLTAIAAPRSHSCPRDSKWPARCGRSCSSSGSMGSAGD
jgi:hypothetical protein